MAFVARLEEFDGNYFLMIDWAAKRGYFFDLDGTLVDSTPGHSAAFHKALAKYFPAIEKTFNYEQFKGQATPDVFRNLGISDESKIKLLTDEKRKVYLDEVSAGNIPSFDGAGEILEYLCSYGKKIFIVTSASPVSARAIVKVKKFDQVVETVVCSDEVKNNKPHPDIFLLALERTGLPSEEIVVIEDSQSGRQAAQSAGLDYVLVNQPIIKNPEIEFKSLNDLYQMLRKIYG